MDRWFTISSLITVRGPSIARPNVTHQPRRGLGAVGCMPKFGSSLDVMPMFEPVSDPLTE
jgi:hypothetical protein